jgi:putative ABC transport system substrate-binding protein
VRRREFITLLGRASVAWPLVARAQQGERMRRIGVLCPIRCADAPLDTFRQALKALQLVEGRNITLVYREAEGMTGRLPELAAELVAQKPDVLVTVWGTAAAIAAKRASDTVPIVAIAVGDLLTAGLVHSLARPGGNLTGLSTLALGLEGKRLELIMEFGSRPRRVAVLWDPDNPYSALATRQIMAAAPLLGVEITLLRVVEAADLDTAFAAMAADRPDALLVPAYLVLVAERERIVKFAAQIRMRAIYSQEEFVRAGGLISYGVDLGSTYARAATYVDKIIKGEQPAELPVEQPTTFRLVINLKTAKALGLDVPPSLVARADEVIE